MVACQNSKEERPDRENTKDVCGAYVAKVAIEVVKGEMAIAQLFPYLYLELNIF